VTTPESPTEEFPRRFRLQRDIDVSGISGTGIVADGVLWPDGTATIRWRGQRASTVNWDRIEDAEVIHGHGSGTRFVWYDERDGELEDLHAYRRATFGVTCANGHHTRNVDLLGDPNDEDWRCAHCLARTTNTEES